MHDEPNLRIMEKHHTGRPYGYGRLPGDKPIRPSGDTLTAVSRPQPIHDKDRDSRGHGRRRKRRVKDVQNLGDLWGVFKDWLDELPGFFEAIAGIIVAPVRLLRRFIQTDIWPVIVCGTVIVGVLGLLIVPFFFGHHGDARRAEGEQLMGSARDMARVEFSKTNSIRSVHKPIKKAVRAGQFDGMYFRVSEVVVPINETSARIYVYPVSDEDSPVHDTPGYIEFDWADGTSSIHWDERKRR